MPQPPQRPIGPRAVDAVRALRIEEMVNASPNPAETLHRLMERPQPPTPQMGPRAVDMTRAAAIEARVNASANPAETLLRSLTRPQPPAMQTVEPPKYLLPSREARIDKAVTASKDPAGTLLRMMRGLPPADDMSVFKGRMAATAMPPLDPIPLGPYQASEFMPAYPGPGQASTLPIKAPAAPSRLALPAVASPSNPRFAAPARAIPGFEVVDAITPAPTFSGGAPVRASMPSGWASAVPSPAARAAAAAPSGWASAVPSPVAAQAAPAVRAVIPAARAASGAVRALTPLVAAARPWLGPLGYAMGADAVMQAGLDAESPQAQAYQRAVEVPGQLWEEGNVAGSLASVAGTHLNAANETMLNFFGAREGLAGVKALPGAIGRVGAGFWRGLTGKAPAQAADVAPLVTQAPAGASSAPATAQAPAVVQAQAPAAQAVQPAEARAGTILDPIFEAAKAYPSLNLRDLKDLVGLAPAQTRGSAADVSKGKDRAVDDAVEILRFQLQRVLANPKATDEQKEAMTAKIYDKYNRLVNAGALPDYDLERDRQ